MHKTSICIPAYGQPGSLHRCLASICRQSLSPDEVIVSDDTPDDSVSAVVEEYRQHLNINYCHNVPSMGTPVNWNNALRLASGDLLLLMHHDDWFYNVTALEELVKSMLSQQCELVFAKSINVMDGTVVSVNDPSPARLRSLNDNIRGLYYHNLIGAPSAVMFRNKGIYFDVALKWLVDVEFYIRSASRGGICYNPRAEVGIGLSSSQMTLQCFNNANVEVGENLLLYGMLDKSWKYIMPDLAHFIRLFSRLLVSSGSFSKKEYPLIARIGFDFAIPVSWFRSFLLKMNPQGSASGKCLVL